jgi:tRNA splicing endonuclease
MQGAIGSGVSDNEVSNSSDERSHWVVMAIKENSVVKVTSYSKVTRLNAPVQGNSSKQL